MNEASLSATAGAVASTTLREFVRTPQMIATTLAQGILFLLVFRYVFGGAIDPGGASSSYVDFMTPGIVVATAAFASTAAAVGVAQDRSEGFADRLRALPTSRLGIVVGRALADTAITLSATLVTFVAAVVVGFRPEFSAPHASLVASLIVLDAAAFASAFGALGSFAADTGAAQGLAFLAIPITFLSSAYVPTDSMPTLLRIVAENQPVTQMINALRTLTDGSRSSAEASTIIAAAVWAGLITMAGLAVSAIRVDR